MGQEIRRDIMKKNSEQNKIYKTGENIKTTAWEMKEFHTPVTIEIPQLQ